MINKIYILVLLNICIQIHGQEKRLSTPPYLKKGDSIALVAPAGILKDRVETINKAKALMENWGLKVILGKNLYKQNKHFAGTDKQRAKDFQEAINNPNIKAIWCARGGYGSVRILDRIDYRKLKTNPKWIIGYSDITAFHNHLHNLNLETMHAIMASSVEFDENKGKYSISSFKKAIFGKKLIYKIKSSKYNRKGEVSGKLIGGNIAILASMLGSKSQMKTDGKILFIEEVGEYKYAIDRMLYSMKRAGYFKNIKAVVVGGMTKIKKNSTPWGNSIEHLISEVVPRKIPILFDFPAGHNADNRALIFGRDVKLIIGKNKKSSLEFNP